MREVLILIFAAPFVLLMVLNDQLKITNVPIVPPSPTQVISIGVPMPSPFIGPPSNIIEDAMRWLGVRYLWGGCTRQGVDCSCFVRNVLLDFGINAPRTTSEQIRWAIPISPENLQPGDLVFFNNTCIECGPNPTHVGMFIGGGMMIDAGDPVQINPVFTGSYGSKYAGGGRPH